MQMVKPPKALLSMFQNLIGNRPRSRTVIVLQKAEQNKQGFVKVSLRGKKGISIIEILIVITIISLTLTSLLGLVSFSLRIASLTKQNNQANNIAQGTMEQVRNFRDGTDWDTDGLGTLTTSTDYYPQKSGTPPQWQLVQGTKTTDGFVKKVVFDDVMRDGSANIIESDGTGDPDTKKVAVTVSWEEKGRVHSVKLITYLTNWKQ